MFIAILSTIARKEITQLSVGWWIDKQMWHTHEAGKQGSCLTELKNETCRQGEWTKW